MGAKKKYVPCILKYVRPISKYVGHIFRPPETLSETALERPTKCRHREPFAGSRRFYKDLYDMFCTNRVTLRHIIMKA